MSASDRPDVSKFRPSNTELRSQGERTEQLVSAIGGGLVNIFAPRSKQDRHEDISRAQRLAEFIRSKLDVRSSGKYSVALVDWSSVNRTYELLCHEPNLADPFIALADFCNILSACIFYDRVVFIDDGQLVHKVSTAMNLAEVFVPLSINEVDSPLAQSLDAHYSWAFHHFDGETQADAQWLTGWR